MNEWIEQYKQYHAEQNTNYPGNNLKPQLHHIKDLDGNGEEIQVCTNCRCERCESENPISES